MRDISHKTITLRTAAAIGAVTCSKDTLGIIERGELPKGDPYGIARAAGLIGAKQTQFLIPHCHPVGIDNLDVEFETFGPGNIPEELSEIEGQYGIALRVHAKSIGRTGIEMEVLTSLSVAALTLYDLLKPVDKNLAITHVRLLDKKGGKTDRKHFMDRQYPCAVLVCSDRVSAGAAEDRSGAVIRKFLEANGADLKEFKVLPDEPEQISAQVQQWVDDGIAFIFCTGGTGIGPRDNTVNALRDMIDKGLPGVAEAMRSHGQMRTPLAMLSRSLAGTIGDTVVVAMPGSSKGVRESLEAIIPAIFHSRNMILGEGH